MTFPLQIPENPYLLLTPGPLSTTGTVKAAMLRDWCTWDTEYNDLVQDIRRQLVELTGSDRFTAVLMQGSGTFCVESAIGSMMPPGGKLLILANGAYGLRMAAIARYLNISHEVHNSGEMAPPDLARLEQTLAADTAITHVAVVHCETTTGLLNPVEHIGPLVRKAGRLFMVDAMSSFGGIPMDPEAWGIDVLISSANKCIQGVPGFGFILARRDVIRQWEGQARSLSLDAYDQWQTMETHGGKWRFTSPTHVVRAFSQALAELAEEGGIKARHRRYQKNQQLLRNGMQELGFAPLLPEALQSPIITAFLHPPLPGFSFPGFYNRLKRRGFVIYPGKVSVAECFRIGSIGEVYPQSIQALLEAVDWATGFLPDSGR